MLWRQYWEKICSARIHKLTYKYCQAWMILLNVGERSILEACAPYLIYEVGKQLRSSSIHINTVTLE